MSCARRSIQEIHLSRIERIICKSNDRVKFQNLVMTEIAEFFYEIITKKQHFLASSNLLAFHSLRFVNLSGIPSIIIPRYESNLYGKLSIIYKLYFCLRLVLREFGINSNYLDDEVFSDVIRMLMR